MSDSKTNSIIKASLSMKRNVDSRIDNFIEEEVLRGKATVEGLSSLRESLIYRIDEQLVFIKRDLEGKPND